MRNGAHRDGTETGRTRHSAAHPCHSGVRPFIRSRWTDETRTARDWISTRNSHGWRGMPPKGTVYPLRAPAAALPGRYQRAPFRTPGRESGPRGRGARTRSRRRPSSGGTPNAPHRPTDGKTPDGGPVRAAGRAAAGGAGGAPAAGRRRPAARDARRPQTRGVTPRMTSPPRSRSCRNLTNHLLKARIAVAPQSLCNTVSERKAPVAPAGPGWVPNASTTSPPVGRHRPPPYYRVPRIFHPVPSHVSSWYLPPGFQSR